MGSSVAQDVPPYVLVAGKPSQPHGINSEGLRRRGFSAQTILQIKRAYKQLYLSHKRLDDAIKALREMVPATPEIGPLVDFLAEPGRGIVR